jgi:hypothetical protein
VVARRSLRSSAHLAAGRPITARPPDNASVNFAGVRNRETGDACVPQRPVQVARGDQVRQAIDRLVAEQGDGRTRAILHSNDSGERPGHRPPR